MSSPGVTRLFRYSQFVTHLPVDYRYTSSHFWAERRDQGKLRVGFTRFATRMLGELVDYRFDCVSGNPVQPGQVLGWIEGFKAVSDVACVGRGVFAGGNPGLEEDLGLIGQGPYTVGWLYEVLGELEEPSLDVDEYAQHLRATLERWE